MLLFNCVYSKSVQHLMKMVCLLDRDKDRIIKVLEGLPNLLRVLHEGLAFARLFRVKELFGWI